MERQAVARVIDAVGSKHTPNNLDREKLSHDLDWAGTWYRTILALREQTKRDRRIAAALKSAKRFQQALSRLNIGDFPQIGLYISEKSAFMEMVQGFVRQGHAALSSTPDPKSLSDEAGQMAQELHLNKRSPFEWLVGVHLPEIFQEFFQKPAGLSRGSAPEAGGPYVRFTEQALIELGIHKSGKPYKAEAIAKALADARKGRSRRKLGKAK